jgi:hypothetical protein
MKVLGYSNLSKKKIWKKIKSPSSIRNGRFHPPKCWGKLQKKGVLYTHSPKRPGPFLKLPKKNIKKRKKEKKKSHSLTGLGAGPQPVGDR